MTKNRICDKCKKQIASGISYIKLVKQTLKEKKLIQDGVGDLCIKCYQDLMGDLEQ